MIASVDRHSLNIWSWFAFDIDGNDMLEELSAVRCLVGSEMGSVFRDKSDADIVSIISRATLAHAARNRANCWHEVAHEARGLTGGRRASHAWSSALVVASTPSSNGSFGG